MAHIFGASISAAPRSRAVDPRSRRAGTGRSADARPDGIRDRVTTISAQQIGRLLQDDARGERAAPAEANRHGHAGRDRSAHGQAEEFQHAMPQWPALARRSRGRSGPAISSRPTTRIASRWPRRRSGAARGFPTVFGVILGTGVGGGIVVNGQVLNGCHGIAGRVGPDGARSRRARFRTTARAGRSRRSSPGRASSAFTPSNRARARKLKEIVARAQTRTIPHAQATIERLTEHFAKAIGIIIDVLDPHAIVLGGGVGNIDALYTRGDARKNHRGDFQSDASKRRCSSRRWATAPASSARRCWWVRKFSGGPDNSLSGRAKRAGSEALLKNLSS